jgi:HPt (histidine-containing phosphotransfer) domain-containing protein
MLLDQMDTELMAIQSEVAASSSSGLAASSHRLKGSLGTIAAVPAYLACSALNQSARSGVSASYLLEFGFGIKHCAS